MWKQPGRRTIAAAVIAVVALGAAALAGVAQSQAAGPPSNTSRPIVLGSFQQGRTLSVLNGRWRGAPASFSYQWQRCSPIGGLTSCADIAGASGPRYRLTEREVGDLVRVQVVAVNTEGSSGVVRSAAVGPVVAAGAPSNSAAPRIGGPVPPRVGQALSGNPGLWIDAAGFAWQWLRCGPAGGNCAIIEGATSQTYTPAGADRGSTLRLLVSATSAGPPVGRAQALSAPTRVVVAAGPVSTSRPVISGTPRVGQTLITSNGTWESASPIEYAFRWRRCNAQGTACQDIAGATQQRYELVAADQGSTIRVVVTATNAEGAASASSPFVGPVAGIPVGETVPVTLVSLPNRLILSASEFTPSVLRSREPFTARFRVTDTEGHFVSGADVFLSAIPFGRVAPPGTRKSDENGWATFTLRPTAKFPLIKGYLITIFARATKPGDDLLAGVSARRLVSVNINPR